MPDASRVILKRRTIVNITFKQLTKPTQSYGRGADSTYQAASYQIFKDGKPVGLIQAEPRRYLESAQWGVSKYDEKGVLRPVRSSLKTLGDAQEGAKRYFA